MLIDNLENGVFVSRRDMQRVLTKEEFATYKNDCVNKSEYKRSAKPPEIKEYERRLKKATLLQSRGQYSNRFKTDEARNLIIWEAEHEFERLREYAAELVGSKSGFQMWFDRDVLKVDGCLTLSDAPQVVTSKSILNQSQIKTKPMTNSGRELKISALSDSLNELTGKLFTKPLKLAIRINKPIKKAALAKITA